MGYYVNIESGAVLFRKEVQSEVLRIWHDLNKPANNELKAGRRFGIGVPPAHWFRWMPEDYDKTLLSVEAILKALGFEVEVDATGDVWAVGYDSKTGQEQLFFDRVSHLITGYFHWKGEDDAEFTWRYDGGVEGLPIYALAEQKLAMLITLCNISPRDKDV
jgi:hypothetical protein